MINQNNINEAAIFEHNERKSRILIFKEKK